MNVPSAGSVVASVVVHQAPRVAFLVGEGAVGLDVARRAALGAVGVVGTASGPRAVGGQRGAAEVVAVQVVEGVAAFNLHFSTLDSTLSRNQHLTSLRKDSTSILSINPGHGLSRHNPRACT